jgi:hypothetical protein
MPSTPTIIKECEQIAEELEVEKMLTEAVKKHKPTIKVDHITDAFRSITRKFKTHLEKIGKEETISIRRIVEMNNKGKMPVMIKHCVTAVQPKLSGGLEKSFIGAHNICFWSFERHGLVNSRGVPTSRGTLREKYHQSSKDPIRNGLSRSAKNTKYTSMFNKVFKKTEMPAVIYKAIHK